MKKILFIHHAASIGGGTYCLLNVVRALDRSKWDPVVALRCHGPLEKELQREGIKVLLFSKMTAIPYNQPLTLRNLRLYLKVIFSLKAFEQLLCRERVDVVYLNNMMIAPYLKPAKRAGCKTVMHVREHWTLGEHKKQLEWVRNIVYENCDKLIAINHYSASIFPKIEATVIYDWIDMSARRKSMPLSELFGEDMTGKKVLLYTGGISPIKGVEYILKSFCMDVKGDDYRLLMLGCENFLDSKWKHKIKIFLSRFGYHYWGKELQDIADSDNRVFCMKAVYELSDLITQSHCFVSYFTIPHANLALAENLFLGNPCIAADTEEAREYSNNGKYAYLVSPMNDRVSLSEGLNDFLKNIGDWKEAAEEGSYLIKRLFDSENNQKKLNSLLDDLCG